MIEIMANINTYIISKVSAVESNINEDFFASDTDEETICRHDPGPFYMRRYMTGGGICGFNFSFYTQSAAVKTARQTQESILEALEIDSFVSFLGLDSGQLIITARPTPVSRSDAGIVIYTSSYRLEYKQEA